MVRKDQFDELVSNCEKILTDMQRRINNLEQRLAKIEARKKPGPKPKQEAA